MPGATKSAVVPRALARQDLTHWTMIVRWKTLSRWHDNIILPHQREWHGKTHPLKIIFFDMMLDEDDFYMKVVYLDEINNF